MAQLRKQEGAEILFHHRFPTSTENVRNACHPFSTKTLFRDNYIMVHNGVVRNARTLKEDHEKRGIEYISVQPDGRFNDSEALAYDLGLLFDGQTDKLSAEGSIAFVVVRRDPTGKAMGVFFGRNYSSPLVMKKTPNSLTISSEGEGEVVPVNKLHYFSYDTGKITTRDLTIYTGYKPPVYQPSTYEPNYNNYQFTNYPDVKYLRRASYNTQRALDLACDDRDKIKSRIDQIDVLYEMDYDDDEVSQQNMELINEYLELEDKLDAVNQAITSLTSDLAKKEAQGKSPMGFRGDQAFDSTHSAASTHNFPRQSAIPYRSEP